MKQSGTTDVYSRYAPRRALGARFEAASVAELYRYRPPYSDEVYTVLESLLEGRPTRVLDAGAGPGKIARELVGRGYAVDAVDASEEMIRVGRAAPGGDDPKLRWIHSKLEEADLHPGYGLAVAGASFHWFDADCVLPLLAEALDAQAVLAVVDGDGAKSPPWEEAEHEIMMDFVSRLEGRRVEWPLDDWSDVRLLDHPNFQMLGCLTTEPASFRQRIDDYIACQHSRASFAPDAMGPRLAQEFDSALHAILTPHAEDGWVRYDRRTRIEWGRPGGSR